MKMVEKCECVEGKIGVFPREGDDEEGRKERRGGGRIRGVFIVFQSASE